jgi:hypothetical protein
VTAPFRFHRLRACFLGQNICALGNGFAILQSPPVTRGPQPTEEGPPAEKQPETQITTRIVRQRTNTPH